MWTNQQLFTIACFHMFVFDGQHYRVHRDIGPTSGWFVLSSGIAGIFHYGWMSGFITFVVQVCGNDFFVPIPFQLPSNHSHSHSRPFLFQHFIPIPIFPSVVFLFPPIPIPGCDYMYIQVRYYIVVQKVSCCAVVLRVNAKCLRKEPTANLHCPQYV